MGLGLLLSVLIHREPSSDFSQRPVNSILLITTVVKLGTCIAMQSHSLTIYVLLFPITIKFNNFTYIFLSSIQ
jgi:hypothetical protein